MSRTHVDYLVSRFPVTSETFIVRELDALARTAGCEIGLRSLFPSQDPPVHEITRPWMARLIRPNALAGLRGLWWALTTQPLTTLSILRTVTLGYAANPSLLVRALATVPLAASHARDLSAAGGSRHIHAHFATYPALAAWMCSRLADVTYSVTVHAHDLYVDQSMLSTKMDDARFIVAISEYNRKLLGRFTETPTKVIHCGIDMQAYTFRPRRIPADGPIRALCVASLQEYKGHDVLLRALALGGPGVDRIELDLIGGGPLANQLARTARELGLHDRVTFLGGQPETAVRQALDQTDLFVLPSIVAADGQMEGLPVALVEALATGAPTVSTRLSGIPEVVIHQQTGLLATPSDAEDLRDVLESLIAAGPDVDDFTRAGRELVEREFDINTTTQALKELLDRV